MTDRGEKKNAKRMALGSKAKRRGIFGNRALASILALVLVVTAAVPALVMADSSNGGGYA
jgi:hypothetical protein